MHKRPAAKSHAKPAAAKPTTHWAAQDVAEWYDRLVGDAGSDYQQHVIIPGVLRMLGFEKPERRSAKPAERGHPRVLELACGQGVLCRRLVDAGCEVVGVDASEALIESARRRDASAAVHYLVADATKLIDDTGHLITALEAESFDAVTLILAIQNMTPLSPVWQACRALLKPGGTLILVMMHPCFRVPRGSDWVWEERDGGMQARVMRQYLTSGKVEIKTHPGAAAEGRDNSTTVHYHRPLQAYVNTLGNAGLLIDHVEEWVSHRTSPPGPRKAALDRSRKEIPLFLALRSRKI